MKHIKPYKLFENNQDDLLEIKDIFQEVSDEWDIPYVDGDELVNLPTRQFAYTIRKYEGNKNLQYLIDIFLPPPNYSIYKGENWYKFREDLDNAISRLKSIGWERTYDDSDGTRYQIVIN